ncbi:unnamed protein product [Acanthoscelides obtectus]|uniref:Uncharacterized protein n=1 Tax=Acanthoscelides obtectus TaxID=200917 RepID=A0A9P0M911_ACAOB|nr:unnamed protein product [Acanthoscelides obtectus]CAK1630744.1 hypothetical protein AOBTE_LOCUS6529 [Acanthoscelides obtectus]
MFTEISVTVFSFINLRSHLAAHRGTYTFFEECNRVKNQLALRKIISRIGMHIMIRGSAAQEEDPPLGMYLYL